MDVRFLDKGKVEKAGGDKVKQVIKVRSIALGAARRSEADQGEQAQGAGRHRGRCGARDRAKRDDLQAVMALLRKEMAELPLSFDNFRD